MGALFNKIIPPPPRGYGNWSNFTMVGEGMEQAQSIEVIAPLDKLKGMIGDSGGK